MYNIVNNPIPRSGFYATPLEHCSRASRWGTVLGMDVAGA
jgi:hypothetical protein